MVLRSMTGFGRAYDERNGNSFEVLIKGVNSRGAEFNFKLPPSLSSLEQDLRGMLQKKIQRGKVTLIVGGDFDLMTRSRISCDRRAIGSFLDVCRSLGLPTSGESGRAAKWEALRIPGVLKVGGVEDVSPQGRRLLFRLARACIGSFVRSKENEGRKMERELAGYARRLEALLKNMTARAVILKKESERRVRELADQFCSDARAVQDRVSFEVAAALDRQDVSEECSRLKFHLSAFAVSLRSADPSPGRKFDFLLQEMQREVNTIGSKGRDVSMSRWVVMSKDFLERMREQVQNVE